MITATSIQQQAVRLQHMYRWEKLKLAFIGAGSMMGRHLDALAGLPGLELVGISSRGGRSGEELANKHGIGKAFTSWQQMIQETKPDAVVVAVTHTVAFEIYKELLSYGIPCLLEKPAGYSVEQCTELVETARQHQTQVMVAVNRRFYSNVHTAIMEVLHHGPVRGLLVEAHEPLQNYRNRQNFDSWVYNEWLVSNSIHFIDLARMIGGDALDVKVMESPQSNMNDRSLSAVFQLSKGVLGTFVAHFNSYAGAGITIYGNGVTAVLKPMEKGRLQYSDGRVINLEQDELDDTYKPGLRRQFIAFFNWVQEGGALPYPASSLSDHLKSLQLIEAFQRAAPPAVAEKLIYSSPAAAIL